jgi:hypothetical protein
MFILLGKALAKSVAAAAVAWVAFVLAASPAEARTHHRHHHPTAAASPATAHRHHKRGHHASAAPAPAHGRHHRHSKAAAATRRGAKAGRHAAHGRHHRGGRRHETIVHTHKRHAALCQSVMVRHHWVQRCRG